MGKSIFWIGCCASMFLLIIACKKDKNTINKTPIEVKANFIADVTNIIIGDTVNFTDTTKGFPLKWNWIFEGGTPGNSTQKNPTGIVYLQEGMFDVTLIVSNAFETDTLVRKNYIKVQGGMPAVTSVDAYDLDVHEATGGGAIVDPGRTPLIEAGVCWSSTNNKPTVNDSKILKPMTEVGDFSFRMTGLQDKTTYYYRAFARNGSGIGYGGVKKFTTWELDTCDLIVDENFTDNRDGQKYRFFELGGKTWMGENLNYDTGESWCYNDLEENCEKYGKLYTIDAALHACPTGWHLPSVDEWNQLIAQAGEKPGNKLKKKNVWSNFEVATNNYCYSGLPAGNKNIATGIYSTMDFFGYWWTSSKNKDGLYIGKNISYDSPSVTDVVFNIPMALSVRCVKD